MSDNRELFYHIYSTTMSGCSLELSEREHGHEKWSCKGCLGPKPGTRSVDVRLQRGNRMDKPMSFVGAGFPGIATTEFLAQLDPEIVERDLYLGRVFGSDGKLREDWKTFHGRHRLIIRGTENISQRICSECGRVVYFAMGERYLSPLPPKDADVFESDLSGLIFKAKDFRRLDLSKWRKGVDVDELRAYPEILAEPTGR